ncbi:MAG TPA: RNA 2',3'-cyclic phosphodiesterase [Streptosporangiaceae bacterium]|nr:RNA 2',3'-cyclic phosphodiesterase [Streptosporangiaceae bacterium]
MRLFIAIAPPAAVLGELEAVAAPLRPGRPDLRWTRHDAWHITLAFLGQVDDVAAGRLAPRLERAARRHSSFSLSFSGAGAFPSGARARVLWIGLRGDIRALASLAESVSAGARRAGAPPPDEGRQFRPHLTLARCRAPADVSPLVTALTGFTGAPWTAEEIHLIRSYPGPRPAYETFGRWTLGPQRPAGAEPRSVDQGDKH